jgi:DNA-binding protein YbaB
VEASPAANAALKARLGELLDEFDRVRKNLDAAQARMRTMRGTARSADGTVTATVDFRGNLTGLELTPRAYSRYSPSLLAEEILRLTNEARAQVTAEMGEVMAPFLPQGVEYPDLMAGTADTSQLSFPAPLTNENFDAWRARFSGRPTTVPEDDPIEGRAP